MVVPVQVAFQGGGAKLCDLLAAAEALQNLVEDKELAVTRVAGTSAGAIVACLYASGIPMALARERFAKLGSAELNAITRPGPKWLGRRLSTAWRLVRGMSIYDEAKLRLLLADLYVKDGKKLTSFQQLEHCEVIVTAADIRTGKSVAYSRSQHGAMSFLDCVMDSCAIPFVFRSSADPRTTIDGGACENLPVELLASDPEHGNVVGFSFPPRDEVSITGNASYVGAIIDTMLSHSIARSKRAIGEENICEIHSDVGIFEFEKCLLILGDAASGRYQQVLSSSQAWLLDRVKQFERPVARPETYVDELMKKIYDIHDLQHDSGDVVIEQADMTIVANGLLHRSNPKSLLPDDISDSLHLTPMNENLSSVRLASNSKYGEATSLATSRLFDRAGRLVPTIGLPIKIRDGISHQKFPGANFDSFVLFFFRRGLDPQNGPYRLERLSTQLGSLNKLAETPPTLDYVLNTTTHPIKRYEIVIYLPETYANTQLQDAATTRLPFPAGLERGSLSGRELTDAELTRHKIIADFVAKGWVFEDLKAGDRVGVVLVPVSPGKID